MGYWVLVFYFGGDYYISHYYDLEKGKGFADVMAKEKFVKKVEIVPDNVVYSIKGG